MAELATVDHLGRQWLFNNHGHRTLEWDDHCNRAYTRWILREHGLTLTGPTPESFMPAVPAFVLRHEAAASLPTLLTDLATWVDIDAIAWGQRYAVVTACRILYTLETAQVASKCGALEWPCAPSRHAGGRFWPRYATNAVSAGNRDGRHARAKPTPPAHSSATSWGGPSEHASEPRNPARAQWSIGLRDPHSQRLRATVAALSRVGARYSVESASSAGQGGPSRSKPRIWTACRRPFGNSSRTSQRQAATIARTSRRHSWSRPGRHPDSAR